MSDPDHHPDDPYTPAEAYAPPSPREKPMGFWEHLEELRGTLIKSVVTFVVFAAVIGYFITEFSWVLQWPLHRALENFPGQQIQLGTQSPLEVFTMLIQICVLGGLLLALPFVLFYVAQFVAPALTEREMKVVLPMCISAMILFLMGAAFGFFLLMPTTIRFSVELMNKFELRDLWTVGRYYGMLSWLVLGVGASFEFPLVVVVLVWLGILSTNTLRKYRRHAIVVIFIIAAIVTPTPDPITQTIFAVPLYLLFEIAVMVSARIEKKRGA